MSNEGIGPATFKFASVTNGDYEFTTNESGELEPIQWWDITEAEGRYIKPREYTVTEIVPPPGYEPTTEVQQIKLELDADGNGIPAGPLVFKNLAKVGLRIVKYDRQSHTPMAGVTFEIYRDGTSIGRYETNAGGEILLTGIASGTYRAFEVDIGDDSHILDSIWQEVELVTGDGTKDLFFFNDVLPGMKRLSGRFKKIWRNQNGCCYHCGLPIEISDERKIFYKVPLSMDGKDEVSNMAYVHKYCQSIFLERRAKA